MANVSVFNLEGNEVGTLELNDAVFGVEVNEHLVHMAVVAQLANKRPQWTGGGVVFAPTPRDYTIRLNKKEKRAALKSALTSRVNENKFIVVEAMNFDEIKTKKFVEVMNNLKVNKALVVLDEACDKAVLSARNVADVKTASVSTINVYDILKYNTVVATKAAVASIEEVYA